MSSLEKNKSQETQIPRFYDIWNPIKRKRTGKYEEEEETDTSTILGSKLGMGNTVLEWP